MPNCAKCPFIESECDGKNCIILKAINQINILMEFNYDVAKVVIDALKKKG